MFTQPTPTPVAETPAPAPVSGHTPTAEQAAAIDGARGGADLVIEAGAGTGKTEVLSMLARVRPRPSLYVAYNRTIANDAAGRFPAGTRCATAHSLAYRAVGHRFAARLNAPRVPAREVAGILGIPAVVDLGAQALTGVKVARVVTDTVDRFCRSADAEAGPRHVPDVPGLSPEAMSALRVTVVPLARAAWHDLGREDGRLRFQHDHYLKIWAMSGPELPYPTIMLDEAQDADPLIAQVVTSQSAQKVLVGDRSQAIYGWRGALDAMDGFLATGAPRYQLTQSWRFGPAIAEEANGWLELLGARLRLSGNPGMDSRLGRLAEADAVLCRSNAGAIAEVMAALEAGHPAAMAGGGGDIRRMAEACRDLRSGRGTSHPELMAFRSWTEVQEYAEHDAGGSDLKTFVKLIDSHGPEAIIGLVDRLVPEDAAKVVVSTAHRAKGREWPTVRLAADFSDRPYYDVKTGELLREEVMLRYVAVTRARDVLDKGGPSSGAAPVHVPESEPEPEPGAVELPGDAAGWLKLYKEAVGHEAHWKAIKDAAAEKLKDFLGEATEATVDGLPALTYRWSKPGGALDSAGLKKDHPDIYAKYYKEKKAARPFKLAGAWAQ